MAQRLWPVAAVSPPRQWWGHGWHYSLTPYLPRPRQPQAQNSSAAPQTAWSDSPALLRPRYRSGWGAWPDSPPLGAGHPWCQGMWGGLAVPFAWPGSHGDKDIKCSLACLSAWGVPSPWGRVGERWSGVASFLGLALGSLGSSVCAFAAGGWLLNHRFCQRLGSGVALPTACSAPLWEGLLGTRGHAGRRLASLPPGTVIVGCPGVNQVPGEAGGAGGAPGMGGSSTGIYTLELEKREDVQGAAAYELGYDSGEWSRGVLLSSALTRGPPLPPQSQGDMLGILGWSHCVDSRFQRSWVDWGACQWDGG